MKKFKDSYIGLFILTVISILAGLGLAIAPEKTHPLLIRFIGVVWILEGIGYGGKLLVLHIEDRIKSRTGKK